VSTLGTGVDAFWDGLLAGRNPLAPNAAGIVAGAAGPVDLREVVRTTSGRRIDHASLLALAAARLALADAGLSDAGLGPRAGLALGSALGNLRETPPFLDRLFDKGAGNPLAFPNMVMNAPLSYCSIELGVSGPTALLAELDVAGVAAIQWGARLVADGAADVCLAGATDEVADILTPILGASGGLTRTAARPLDRESDGRALGEGAAVLVLEPWARAVARGARIYAELEPHAGFGVPSPVHGHPRDPAPIARGLAPLAQDVGFVVSCASGLPALDALEAEVLSRTFGTAVPVVAPRGTLGDFGAAGALGVAVAALALHHGRVPPTIGCRLPARAELDVVVEGSREVASRVAVVNAIGRGGLCRPVRLVRRSA
jgi:3-oxoacyl-[acyl-carrier-protein] synthase II